MNKKKLLFLILCNIIYFNISGEIDSEQNTIKTIKTIKTIMLSPAGDSKNTGRNLTNSYERAVSYKLAEAIGKAIESRYDIRVILARSPGEKLVHLQAASFANRLNVDLFINLNIYKENQVKPKFYLMYRKIDPFADFTLKQKKSLEFVPVRQAHIKNIYNTKSIATQISEALSQSKYQKIFDFYGPYSLPLIPLEGVVAPAVLFEIGVNDEMKLAQMIQPIVSSVKFLLDREY